jgi:acylphosphatase
VIAPTGIPNSCCRGTTMAADGGAYDRRAVPDSKRKVRRRVVVHGRVQGVFFRDSLRRVADQRGVAGWAENAADGTLVAVFEGEREAVDRLVAFCHDGPRGAEVARVEVADDEPEDLTGFSIR